MPEPFEWQATSPECQGMDSRRLDAMRVNLAKRKTKALLVVRHDRVVGEWYAKDFGPTVKHYTASLVKALVGGMSLILALNDGLLDVDDPAWKYVPQWKDHPLKSKITVRHLATHTSGMEDLGLRDVAADPDLIRGWQGRFWPDLEHFITNPDYQKYLQTADPFRVARDDTRILFEPGTDFLYSNPGIGMLSYVITAALRDTPCKDVRTYLRERIMRPIGVSDDDS